MAAQPIQVVVDGKPMKFQADSQPFILKGRTLVPLRAISEYFNCEVKWFDGVVDPVAIAAKDVYSLPVITINPRNQTGIYPMHYEFYVGFDEYSYSGPNGHFEEREYDPQVLKMDVPPMIKNNRTFVPLRVIGEMFGKVEWNQETRTVTITTGPLKNKFYTIDKKIRPGNQKVGEVIFSHHYHHNMNLIL